jgi:hypothetical protein
MLWWFHAEDRNDASAKKRTSRLWEESSFEVTAYESGSHPRHIRQQVSRAHTLSCEIRYLDATSIGQRRSVSGQGNVLLNQRRSTSDISGGAG